MRLSYKRKPIVCGSVHFVVEPSRALEPTALIMVVGRDSGGSTPMWKSVLKEAREVVWLASLVCGLSAVGVGIAVALAAG